MSVEPLDGLRVFERGWLSSNNLLIHAAPGEPGAVLVDTGHVNHAPQTVALKASPAACSRARACSSWKGSVLYRVWLSGPASSQEVSVPVASKTSGTVIAADSGCR